MSITVQNLTKIYGSQKAVNNISFEINKGEIVGFLGQNGAGKSTTMKMITCFLPPTSGTASVSGYNIETHPDEVRQRIGYLPEHNPLYTEMYIREYLEFVGGLHKIGDLPKRIDEIIEKVGLGKERKKLIGQLSKGYRQRVGLAQAMLHNPDVLILDEPTSGLDPIQLEEIRTVIKEIGKEKTIMLSTHIMQEVEAICDRIIIINQGEIVADNATQLIKSNFENEHHEKSIMVELLETIKPEDWQGLKVAKARLVKDRIWLLQTQDDKRAQVFQYVVQKGWTILSMYEEKSKLEDVFKEITTQASSHQTQKN